MNQNLYNLEKYTFFKYWINKGHYILIYATVETRYNLIDASVQQ